MTACISLCPSCSAVQPYKLFSQGRAKCNRWKLVPPQQKFVSCCLCHATVSSVVEKQLAALSDNHVFTCTALQPLSLATVVQSK
jgi:hypothetical protein